MRIYFDKPELDDRDIAALLDRFYAADLPQNQSTEDPPTAASKSMTSSGGNANPLLDKHTIDLIVQLANEVNLFKEQLNAEDVATRYATGTLQAVTSRNNTKLVLLLDKLATHGIIPFSWQAFISKGKLVISSSGRKHLNQHDLSSTLNRAKDTLPGIAEKKFLSIIDSYIERIKNRKDD